MDLYQNRYGSWIKQDWEPSGAIVLTYGRRVEPFGQRALISRDNGETWEDEYILRDDAPNWDLGYPSTVELWDGSLLTVYYQTVQGDKQCSLHWTRWNLSSN